MDGCWSRLLSDKARNQVRTLAQSRNGTRLEGCVCGWSVGKVRMEGEITSTPAGDSGLFIPTPRGGRRQADDVGFFFFTLSWDFPSVP